MSTTPRPATPLEAAFISATIDNLLVHLLTDLSYSPAQPPALQWAEDCMEGSDPAMWKARTHDPGS